MDEKNSKLCQNPCFSLAWLFFMKFVLHDNKFMRDCTVRRKGDRRIRLKEVTQLHPEDKQLKAWLTPLDRDVSALQRVKLTIDFSKARIVSLYHLLKCMTTLMIWASTCVKTVRDPGGWCSYSGGLQTETESFTIQNHNHTENYKLCTATKQSWLWGSNSVIKATVWVIFHKGQISLPGGCVFALCCSLAIE